MPVAYAPARREVEGHDRAEERVGRLDRDARAVAGVGFGAGRAPVVEAAHGGERLVEDRVALAAQHVDDEADAAAVVLEARVVETLRRREVRVRVRLDGAAVAIGHVMSSSCSGGQLDHDRLSGAGHCGTTLARRRSEDCSGRAQKSPGRFRPWSGVFFVVGQHREPDRGGQPGREAEQLVDADGRALAATPTPSQPSSRARRRSTFSHFAFDTSAPR